jgi:hypothetical protein
MGRNFFDQAFKDWEQGVKEKHPTRAEVKMINEEGSFPKMIEEDIIPFFANSENCSFDTKEGYFEMANQLMRAKIRALRKAGGSLFGPKKVISAKEVERRRVVAENARTIYELLKSTQLILDALNWRTTDKRLQAAEYELSGIDLDDSRVRSQRERMFKILKKCISKLSQVVQPSIGLLPSGRRRPIKNFSYGLEGEPGEDPARSSRKNLRRKTRTTMLTIYSFSMMRHQNKSKLQLKKHGIKSGTAGYTEHAWRSEQEYTEHAWRMQETTTKSRSRSQSSSQSLSFTKVTGSRCGAIARKSKLLQRKQEESSDNVSISSEIPHSRAWSLKPNQEKFRNGQPRRTQPGLAASDRSRWHHHQLHT